MEIIFYVSDDSDSISTSFSTSSSISFWSRICVSRFFLVRFDFFSLLYSCRIIELGITKNTNIDTNNNEMIIRIKSINHIEERW